MNIKLVENNKVLEENTCKWDENCPHMLIFPASKRGVLATSKFVKESQLIVQVFSNYQRLTLR